MKDPRVKSVGPHYQCKRAFADGWSVEERPSDSEDWTPLESGVFIPSWQYRIVPDAEGWLPHYAHEGAVCPVANGTRVVIEFSELGCETDRPQSHDWGATEDPILRYRVIKEAEKPEPTSDSDAADSQAEAILRNKDFWHDSAISLAREYLRLREENARLADKRGYVPVEKLPSVNLDVSPLAELNRLHFELEALRKEYGK